MLDFNRDAAMLKAMTTTNPTVSAYVHGPEDTSRRFRLEGGTLAEGWEPREGRRAWCELTVSTKRGAEGRLYVTTYGGEVWPGAWPHLFTSARAFGAPATWLTKEGETLLFGTEVPAR
jgi:hypothetical protein